MEWKVEGLTYSIINKPQGVQRLKVAGKGTVTGCSIDQPWFYEHITEVYLEEGITEIGYNAFAGLLDLKSVCLPATLKRICAGAFSGCPELEEIRYMGELSKLQKVKVAQDALPLWFDFSKKKKGKERK